MTTTRSSEDADVVEVEFAVTDPVYPFADIARSADCRIVLEKLLPRSSGRQSEYFNVDGADPAQVVEFASGDAVDGIEEARSLATTEDGGLVELVVADGCPARFLAEEGAMPTSVEGTPCGAKIVAEVMPADDPGDIVDAFVEEHAVELVAKRTLPEPTPLLDESDLQTAILERLTNRQQEVLYAAHEAGYYQRPRRKTGEEIAAELDISPTTFQQHIRAAERKLVTFLVEDR